MIQPIRLLCLVLILASTISGSCQDRYQSPSPLLLRLSVDDAAHASTNPNTPSQQLKQVREFYRARDISFTHQEVGELLRKHNEQTLTNDHVKVIDNLKGFSYRLAVGTMIDQYSRKSVLAKLGGELVKGAANAGIDWYYGNEAMERDNLIKENFRQDLDSFHHSTTNVTAEEVRNYYRDHGDALLGSDLIDQLKQRKTSDADILEVQRQYLSRLIEIVFNQGKRIDNLQLKGISPDNLTPKTKKRPKPSPTLVDSIALDVNIKTELSLVSCTQQSLNDQMKSIQIDKRTPRNDVLAMYTMLYSQLPASQQLAMFRKRPIGGIEDTFTELAMERSLETRVVLEEAVPTLIGYMKDIGRIAGALNAPKDVQEAINITIATSTALNQAAEAFFVSGNYLNGAAQILSLVSIFAGSESSIEAQRHEAVMNALGDIRKLQVATLKLVYENGLKLDRLIEAVDFLADDVDSAKLLAREELEKKMGIGECSLMQKAREDNSYDDESGDFRGEPARMAYFTEFTTGLKQGYFTDCIRGLDDLFGGSEPRLSSLFRQEVERDDRHSQSRRFREALELIHHNTPPLDTISDKGSDWQDSEDRLFSVAVDSSSLRDIPTLLSRLQQPSSANTSRFLPAEEETLLSVASIDKYVTFLLGNHYLPALVSSHANSSMLYLQTPLQAQAHITSPAVKSGMKWGEAHLRQALKIVNTAIAQQTLLSGSVTLIAIDNKLTGNEIPRALRWQVGYDPAAEVKQRADRAIARSEMLNNDADALGLLQRYPTLAANYVLFISMVEFDPTIWDGAKPITASKWGPSEGAKPLTAQIARIKTEVPNSKIEATSFLAMDNHFCPEAWDVPLPTDKRSFTSNTFCNEVRSGKDGVFYSINGAAKESRALGDCTSLFDECSEDVMFGTRSIIEKLNRENEARLEILAPPNFSTRFRIYLPMTERVNAAVKGNDVPELTIELTMLLQLKSKLLSEIESYSAFDTWTQREKDIAMSIITRDKEHN